MYLRSFVQRSYGVMAITLDFESNNPSSNLGRTSIFSGFLFPPGLGRGSLIQIKFENIFSLLAKNNIGYVEFNEDSYDGYLVAATT